MYQSISYYDAVLSHDHPTYQGMLRMHLNATKLTLTKNIVRLTIVTLTFLPLASVTGTSLTLTVPFSRSITIRRRSLTGMSSCQCIGLFSENIRVPHNGDRETHLRADGTRSPFNWFGGVICLVFFVMCLMWWLIWLIFRSTRRKFKIRGHIISWIVPLSLSRFCYSSLFLIDVYQILLISLAVWLYPIHYLFLEPPFASLSARIFFTLLFFVAFSLCDISFCKHSMASLLSNNGRKVATLKLRFQRSINEQLSFNFQLFPFSTSTQ